MEEGDGREKARAREELECEGQHFHSIPRALTDATHYVQGARPVAVTSAARVVQVNHSRERHLFRAEG